MRSLAHLGPNLSCLIPVRGLQLIRNHAQAAQLATDHALLMYRNVKVPLLPPSLDGLRKRVARVFSRSSEVFLVDNFRSNIVAMDPTSIIPVRCANQIPTGFCKSEGLYACKNCKLVAVSIMYPLYGMVPDPDIQKVLRSRLSKATLVPSQKRMQEPSQ